MHFLKKLLHYTVPSAVFFEDGSRVDYITASQILVYVSPTGCGVRIPVVQDKENGGLAVEMPHIWTWDKPLGQPLSEEEMRDARSKITQYVKKQGKPFYIRVGNV